MISPIVKYINGGGTDHAGRTLAETLKFDNALLEHTHDYIQWMFPTDEASMFNMDAPVLTDVDIEHIKADIRLYEEGFERMLRFYGFRVANYSGDAPMILPSYHNFKDRVEEWATPNNHNYLRITRILKSLCLLGFYEYAVEFLSSLETFIVEDYGHIVGEKTIKFWRDAVVDYNATALWILEYEYNYSERHYAKYFFYGPRTWAQGKANEMYATFPDWMKNDNLYRRQETIKSLKEFTVEHYSPNKWETPLVQIYSK